MENRKIQFEKIASVPLLVTGSIAYDDILTPAGNGEKLLGGSASYAAIAASFFTTTRLVGNVGNDFAESDWARFSRRKIDTAGVEKNDTGRTFHWRGRYFENYNRRETLDTQLGVFENFLPTLNDTCKTTPFVLLANIAPSLQLRILDQMKNPEFIVADTMDFWINTAREALETVVSRADLFILNDTEATHLTGEKNLISAGKSLLKKNDTGAIIIKKGEHGAALFHRDGMFALPAFPVENLRDPTGAGDSFAGALAAVLAASRRTDFPGIKRAMLYATAVASLTVESFSTENLENAGIIEIENRAEFLRKMIALPE